MNNKVNLKNCIGYAEKLINSLSRVAAFVNLISIGVPLPALYVGTKVFNFPGLLQPIFCNRVISSTRSFDRLINYEEY